MSDPSSMQVLNSCDLYSAIRRTNQDYLSPFVFPGMETTVGLIHVACVNTEIITVQQ